jgi:hypothetical protein
MAGWPSQTEVKPDIVPEVVLTPEQEAEQVAIREKAIRTWLVNKQQLANYKEVEMASRVTVTDMLFPTPSRGTQRYSLGNGYAVKLVQTYIYNLGSADKLKGDGTKYKVRDQVDDVLDKIEKLELGPEVDFIIERLIKWSPEVSISEYEKLADSAVGLKVRDEIDKILTVKPGSPQLTFEEPKAK